MSLKPLVDRMRLIGQRGCPKCLKPYTEYNYVDRGNRLFRCDCPDDVELMPWQSPHVLTEADVFPGGVPKVELAPPKHQWGFGFFSITRDD